MKTVCKLFFLFRFLSFLEIDWRLAKILAVVGKVGEHCLLRGTPAAEAAILHASNKIVIRKGRLRRPLADSFYNNSIAR